MMFDPLAAVLVFGGTFSATLIAYPWDVFKSAPSALRFMFFPPKHVDNAESIDVLTKLAEKARRQSIESLESDINGISDRFMQHGVRMLIDGLDTEIIRDNLEKEILYVRQRHQKVAGVYRTMATLAPIFGLLGTLIGVVQVLRNLSDPENLGRSMAIAITTTFYGIFAANFLFLPTAIKLTEHSENEILAKELVAEGILAIQQGDLPMIVKKKLNAFMAARTRESTQPKK
jgi:chemotaxis protein MotA